MWTVSAFTFLALVICYLLLDRKSQSKLPRLGIGSGPFGITVWPARIDFAVNGYRRIRQVYEQSDAFHVRIHATICDFVVLGPRYLQELCMLPESKLNPTLALVESVLGQYNGVDIMLKGHLGTDIARVQLTKHLPELLPRMAEELQSMLPKYLESNAKAGSADAYKLVYKMIEGMSSRVFVGRPYCYDPVWTEAVSTFPQDVEKTVLALFALPDFVRSHVVQLLPAKRRLIHNRAKASDLLFPKANLEGTREQLTVQEFLYHNAKDKDPDVLTSRILLLTAAAFHNSSTAATNALFDLCARREYLAPLRAEVREALEKHGNRWSMEVIKVLPLLDSFLKESQRMNTQGFFEFNRKVMVPLELSDGTIIEPGETITMAAGAMAVDKKFYDDPSKFDGFRFATRDQTEAKTKTGREYTDTEPGNLSWGYGRYTCPGRWYASAMIKLFVGMLLDQYDFEFPEGQTTRPANKQLDVHLMPDFSQAIFFKVRTAD